MFKRIDHVAVHVSDLDRSVKFYERHFGFKHYFQHAAGHGMQIAYLKLGDTVLELTHHTDGAMKGFHFCLETDNLDDTVAQLQNDGVAPAGGTPEQFLSQIRKEIDVWRKVAADAGVKAE